VESSESEHKFASPVFLTLCRITNCDPEKKYNQWRHRSHFDLVLS
jgi:hypothetical protein